MFLIAKKIIKNIIKLYEYIFNYIMLKIYKINLGNNVKINGKLFVRNKGTININDNVKINSKYAANPIGGQVVTSFFVKENAKLTIGNGVGLSNTAICVFESVNIEDNVFIGGDCKIYDTDFHSTNYYKRISSNDDNVKTAPIRIKKGAFIGSSCIILKGVTIGKYSIVGAGSLVTRNIPDGEIWGGNPIRFIRKQDNEFLCSLNGKRKYEEQL